MHPAERRIRQFFKEAHTRWRAFRRQTAGTANALMSSFRLGNGLSDFGTAVGALVDKVDPRHAPMRLDLPHEHRKYSYTAGADDRRGLSFVVLDVGWHVGSPSQRKHGRFNPESTYRTGRMLIINSCERTRNGRAILTHVALWQHPNLQRIAVDAGQIAGVVPGPCLNQATSCFLRSRA